MEHCNAIIICNGKQLEEPQVKGDGQNEKESSTTENSIEKSNEQRTSWLDHDNGHTHDGFAEIELRHEPIYVPPLPYKPPIPFLQRLDKQFIKFLEVLKKIIH